MFSSLPSASKIYVSSCKPKQKNLNSAKKKRKKPTASSSTPIRICDEETLVSSISLHKDSCSRLSLNSNESLDIALNSKTDEILNVSEEVIDEENTNSINAEIGHVKSKCTDSISKSENSAFSSKSQSLKSSYEESKPAEVIIKDQSLTNVVPDSIYCDEYCETDVQECNDTQKCSENTENALEISTSKSSAIKIEQCDKIPSTSIYHVCEKSISSPPVYQLTTEDSAVQTDQDGEMSGKDSILIVQNEIFSETNNDIENIGNENLIYNQVDSDPGFLTSGDNLNCEKNIFENPYTENENKNTAEEKSSSDVESSSGQSDCCAATNLFDIHVDNSEHSSLNENQISNGHNCRMQSPEQSEVSCTESIMYDVKSAYQNESPFQSCLGFVEELSERSEFINSNHKKQSDINNLPEELLDNSHSSTNIQFATSNSILKRSLSLPSKMCNSESVELLNKKMGNKALYIHKSNFDNYVSKSSKCLHALDKSTFTVDLSVVTSDKSTLTSNFISSSHCKRDAATTPVKNRNEVPLVENEYISTALKDSAMLVMNVLPPVAIMQARARSYVFGSVGATRSLLGNEELSRFFPDGRVTVFVGTWNMNGHDPPECIDDFILPLDVSSVPDIYAVGVQESMQSRSEWEVLLQTTLGPSHVLFASTSFGVLHLSIFMRRDLIWFCSEPEEANVATRPGSMIKTKGAVAICFMFFGTSILFVNSHLTAHEQKLKERLSDYEKICSALDLPKNIPLRPHQRGKDVTSRFDYVFWCGDLNFRVVQDRPSVLSFVEKIKNPEPSCNLLMKHDQLTQSMAKGAVFHGFNEGIINFIPSYKFDVGTSSFDSAKQRVPSYTDRILYRSNDKSSVVCLHYDSVSKIFTSDHKPVFAVFKVSIKPGRDNIPLAAGLFKRDIYLEAIKRRAQQLEVARNHKQSTICNVM